MLLKVKMLNVDTKKKKNLKGRVFFFFPHFHSTKGTKV